MNPPTTITLNPPKLQCGRTFSSAEVRPRHRKPRPDCRSFNVAALFQVRKCFFADFGGGEKNSFNVAALFQVRKFCAGSERAGRMTVLQCGRTFSSAEVWDGYVKNAIDCFASMWPHFFKCGSVMAGAKTVQTEFVASMWPHFFKCGSRTARRITPAFAAALQCGRTFSSAEVKPRFRPEPSLF